MLALLAAGTDLASAAAPHCTLVKTSQFPVTISPGAVPLVSGTINGQEAHLVLDTGAFFSVLAGKTVEKFHLQLETKRRVGIAWVGDRELAQVTRVEDFSLEGLAGGTAHNIDFVVSGTDLSGADGLLGENVLGAWDTEYDLANGVVRIFHPLNCSKADPLAYWHGNSDVGVLDTEKRTPESPHIRSTARLDGVKLRVLFDTGATRSLLTRQAAAKAGFKPEGPGVTPRGVGATRLTPVRAWVAPFKTLEVGGEVIRNVRLEVGELRDPYPEFDLLLGADFFLAHRVYVAKEQRRMYFTYNGGPIFDLRSHDDKLASSAVPAQTAPAGTTGTAAPTEPATAVAQSDATASATGSDTPTDAAGFRRRAAASAARGDLAAAYQDFDRAIELAPTDVDTYYQRALLHQATLETQQALTDLDQVVRLRPTDVRALMLRGRLRLAANEQEPKEALSDFDAAIRAAPEDVFLPLQVAAFLEDHSLPDAALAHYDQWIAANPTSPRRAAVLHDRCRLRALQGKQLDLALKDCNEALQQSVTPRFLNTRGLVYLRLGQPEKAIVDYRNALRINPVDASSMYALGLAQRQKGNKREGERDLKIAVALRASVAEEYRRLGLTPESSEPGSR